MEGEDVMEGEDDDEQATALVALTIDGECDITSYDWMKLCKMQNKAMNAARLVQADNFAKELPGHCLALEDRNSLAEEWPGRRVFVVRGATSACIFDEDGDAIDEPSDFVSAGVQPLEDEDESKTFGHDWDAGFYRYNHEHKEKDEDDEEEEEDDDDDVDDTTRLARRLVATMAAAQRLINSFPTSLRSASGSSCAWAFPRNGTAARSSRTI